MQASSTPEAKARSEPKAQAAAACAWYSSTDSPLPLCHEHGWAAAWRFFAEAACSPLTHRDSHSSSKGASLRLTLFSTPLRTCSHCKA